MNKVYLIDDDEDDQLLFKEAILSLSVPMHCDTAMNGQIALENLKKGITMPDIIFLDLNMPIMNGFDFLKQIKKDDKLTHIPVGIFSTSNNASDKELAKELGANFFITKPNDFQALIKKLQQILTIDFAIAKHSLII
jgi:CheY-like chemotaxis protein